MSLEGLFREAAARRGLALAERRYGKGEALFRQGELPGGIHVLVEGLVRGSILEENGKELLVALAGPGEALGEVEYLLGLPLICEVRALEPVRSLYAGRPVLDRLLAEDPRLGLGLATLLAERLRRNSLRMSSRLGHPLEYGLLKACLSRLGSPLDLAALRRSDLAEYLGLTERHLSRLLKGLAARGILAVEAGRVRLLDPRAAEARMAELEE